MVWLDTVVIPSQCEQFILLSGSIFLYKALLFDAAKGPGRVGHQVLSSLNVGTSTPVSVPVLTAGKHCSGLS